MFQRRVIKCVSESALYQTVFQRSNSSSPFYRLRPSSCPAAAAGTLGIHRTLAVGIPRNRRSRQGAHTALVAVGNLHTAAAAADSHQIAAVVDTHRRRHRPLLLEVAVRSGEHSCCCPSVRPRSRHPGEPRWSVAVWLVCLRRSGVCCREEKTKDASRCSSVGGQHWRSKGRAEVATPISALCIQSTPKLHALVLIPLLDPAFWQRPIVSLWTRCAAAILLLLRQAMSVRLWLLLLLMLRVGRVVGWVSTSAWVGAWSIG